MSFEFQGFSPRAVFEDFANNWLSHIIEKLPSDAFCQAIVARKPNGFQFTIEVRSGTGTFVAETFLNPKTVDTNRRDWQTQALKQLEKDIGAHLKQWWRERALSA